MLDAPSPFAADASKVAVGGESLAASSGLTSLAAEYHLERIRALAGDGSFEDRS